MAASTDPKEKTIPIVLLAVGALILLVRGLTAGANRAELLVALSVMATVGVILMVLAALVTAKLIGVSFGDFGSATLKFGGIYLVSLGLGSLMPFTGSGLIVFFISFGLILWLFELETYQAVVFAIVLWVVNLIAGLLLAGMFRP